jgi:hypothetical protein
MLLNVNHRSFSNGTFSKVAQVEVCEGISVMNALEIAFEKTNHIDSPWWENAGVTRAFLAIRPRSTSVGDRVEIVETGEVWECISVGWKRIED